MTDSFDDIAWSLYWAQNQLYSCVASDSAQDQAVLEDVWLSFAEPIQAGARVLDLATGNGVVPATLLKLKEFSIDAVDAADIDPTNYLSESQQLAEVRFHAKVDLRNLPFPEAKFDVLTSQFGIEYAGLSEATAIVLEVLRPGGLIGFLVHHADSEILQGSRIKIDEMNILLQEGGVIETLLKMLKGECSFAKLEDAGRSAVDQYPNGSASISGQIFSGINQISQLLSNSPNAAQKLGATMALRLRAERSRLFQLREAAHDERQMQEYVDQLGGMGLVNVSNEMIYADQALLGWFVQAQKR